MPSCPDQTLHGAERLHSRKAVTPFAEMAPLYHIRQKRATGPKMKDFSANLQKILDNSGQRE